MEEKEAMLTPLRPLLTCYGRHAVLVTRGQCLGNGVGFVAVDDAIDMQVCLWTVWGFVRRSVTLVVVRASWGSGVGSVSQG